MPFLTSDQNFIYIQINRFANETKKRNVKLLIIINN